MSETKFLSEYQYKTVPITEKNAEKEKVTPKYGYGTRHVQVVIFLMCLMVNIIGRGHMGVTIVAMTSTPKHSIITTNSTLHPTNNVNITLQNQSKHNLTETELNWIERTNNTTENVLQENSTQDFKIWQWPKSTQEMVLGAFFLGYVVMMFPMGMVCQRYGGKFSLQIALFINGIVSIITPWVSSWGDWKGICCCRLIQGLSQAGTYPSIQNLVAKWVPEDERATLGACVHSGLTVGTIVAYQLAGILGASKWGWPSTFYAVGVICLTSFVILTTFGAATPLEHKSISDKERNYIMGAANRGNAKKLKTPWRAILKSKPLWGTIATHIGSNAAFVFFFNQVPTYIHHTLNIDVRNSGLLSSLPYIASTFTVVLFGWLADYCTNHNIVSKNNTRRIFNSIASCGCAVCLILTSYTSNIAIVTTYLVIAMAANMGTTTGWMVNYIDLSPNFASTILATGNTLSNSLVVLTPITIAYVVTDVTNVMQWRIMFFITAGVSIITNAIFVVLMSTDVQTWNYPDDLNESSDDDKQGDPKTDKMTMKVL